jgi:hypothetical protein
MKDHRIAEQVLGSLRVAYYALGDYAKAANCTEQRQTLIGTS